jgi:hypothetical protein
MGDVAQISAKYTARLAASADDIAASQALRHLAFHGTCGRDSDPFDAICRHVLVEDTATGALMCSFRLLPLPNGRAIEQCYSAQFYELSALKDFTGPMVEMGRFCIHPDHRDPDILRAAWGAMTSYVDAQGVEMLFGCASFKGISEEAYLDAFTLLKDRHIAPKRWLPRIKAPRIFPFARNGRLGQRSRGGRSEYEHAACLHRPRDWRDPARPRARFACCRRPNARWLTRKRQARRRCAWLEHRFCNSLISR